MQEVVMNNFIAPNTYNYLPEVLKEALEPYAEGTQKDLVLLSSLSVLGIAIPNVYNVYGGKIIYPHLYFMAIGKAASGKGVVSDCEHWLTPIQEYYVTKAVNPDTQNELTSDKHIISPGNVTSKQLYRLLNNSEIGIGIIESEADTLSNFMETEHGSFSDVLRKGFHHEPCSISRDNGNKPYNIRISTPKLCMALAGTKGQLAPLMKSVENGLYSRFMCYTLAGITEFKNPFEISTLKSESITTNAESFLLPMFKYLESLEDAIEFKLTITQTKKFVAFFQKQGQFYITRNGQDFDSVVKRHGVMFTRIALILSVLKNYREGTLYNGNIIYCSNKIFVASMEIIKTTLYHSGVVFSYIKKSPKMHKDENDVYNKLNSKFTTIEFREAAKDIFKPRTAYNKLEKWVEQLIIKKLTHGKYEKNSIYDIALD